MEMAILRATCTADALADGWRLTALVTAGPTPPFDLVCTVVMADGTPLRKNFPTVSVGNGVSLHFPADFGLARNQIHPGTIRVDWHAVYKGLIVNIDNLTIDIHPNSENGASDRNPPDI